MSEYHEHGLDCGFCLDVANDSARATANVLRRIVDGADHVGTFGGRELEGAAKAIIALRSRATRADALLRTMREWRDATAAAVARGCNAVGAADVLSLLQLMLAHWDSGSTEPLTTAARCARCHKGPDACQCDDDAGRGNGH